MGREYRAEGSTSIFCQTNPDFDSFASIVAEDFVAPLKTHFDAFGIELDKRAICMDIDSSGFDSTLKATSVIRYHQESQQDSQIATRQQSKPI